MDTSHVFDNRLRPAVEFVPAAVSLAAAGLLAMQPDWFFPIFRSISLYVAGGFVLLGGYRLYQGVALLRYRSAVRQLPRYVLTAKQIPTYRKKLFLGRGFKWTQKHTQRLIEARSP